MDYYQGRTGSNIRPGKILLNRSTLLKTDLFFIQNSIMLGADTKISIFSIAQQYLHGTGVDPVLILCLKGFA